MAFNILAFFSFLGMVQAGVLTPGIPAAVDNSYDNSHYTFGYSVDDPFTGDSKSQVETRKGGFVQGSYSLNDPDGTRRTVDYTADDVNGFNAVVKKTPLIQTVPLAPVHVAHVTGYSHVSHIVPLSTTVESNIASEESASKDHITSNSLSEDTDVVGVPATRVVIPETRITETSNRIVHGSPYRFATYTVPFSRYPYPSVPFSVVSPSFYSPVPYYSLYNF